MIAYDDSIPVSDELLERVRSGLPLREVGRIDLREESDGVDAARLIRACDDHRCTHLHGSEAPIRLRESQAKNLAREFGFKPDDEENPIDLTAPGSRFMGHELWIDPDSTLPSEPER